MRPAKRKPDAGGRRASDAIASMRMLYGKGEATPTRRGWQSPTLPRNWRERMPDPVAYYGQRVAKLGKPNGEGWAQGRCPFHEDRAASLSVNLRSARGGWRCFAGCGKGDMVSFHERLTGKAFKQTVLELLGVRA